jgi:hypothetical protein
MRCGTKYEVGCALSACLVANTAESIIAGIAVESAPVPVKKNNIKSSTGIDSYSMYRYIVQLPV